MNLAPRQHLAPGIAAGLLASLPVALRVTYQGPLSALPLMLGSVSLVVVPVGLWLRRGTLKDPTSPDRALLLGAALSSLPLALFAGVLKSTTHHRPLGGATFAVSACVLLALCVALARRAGTSAVGTPWLKQFLSVCCGLSLLATIALSAQSPGVLFDFVLLAAACVVAASLKIPSVIARIPGSVWVASWGLLLVSALGLTQPAGLRRELEGRAPVSFAALSWLGDGS